MNIAIIGAGASGLFLAKKLSESTQNQIFLFEKNAKIATKLKASGGGKANILNANIKAQHFNNQAFMEDFLQKINFPTLHHEFEKMGLAMTIDDEQRVFPATYFSQTVLDILLAHLSKNVQIFTNFEVQKVQKRGDFWQINDFEPLFEKVVFATGSPANCAPKNRQHYNAYLADFQLRSEALAPSLVGFKIKNYPKSLFGCRAQVIASLYQRNKLIFRELGEVTFKEDGISGIVILNCSAHYNRLKEKKNCTISLNFCYENEDFDVAEYWQKHHSFCGLLHPKLWALYQRQPFDIQHFTLEIDAPYDLSFAQVAHGGVALSEVDENLQLRRYKNLYMMGEMLDIDGVCGGYNLFFAFASALRVAQSINKR